MEQHTHPLCAWMGLSPDTDQTVSCGKPAIGYVLGANGHRVFTCEEHIAHAKQAAQSGKFVHSTHFEEVIAPATHHAAVEQDHHNASVVGTME